ncbi:MAG: nucleoside triphosphate pyrophosphohydrolase, partial [FCB group bacterium]|nr:nucleoside triphosphate pyrophosphohydrolase [FCB group bacterium]
MTESTRACRQFNRLIEILNRLRAKDGCEWDREQTSESLVPYLLEEAYEVIEAIEEKDEQMLKEELGDLSLHILFQAHIANEKGDFDIADSLEHICDKLIRRHPHIFDPVSPHSSTSAKQNWETIKQKEKQRENFLDGVPKTLPALTRARRIQEKAANIGFDWKEIEPVWAKVDEEFSELQEAYANGIPEEIEDELGDVLFSLVNLGRFLNISSEDALRRTILKFETRFQGIERRLKEQGKTL